MINSQMSSLVRNDYISISPLLVNTFSRTSLVDHNPVGWGLTYIKDVIDEIRDG